MVRRVGVVQKRFEKGGGAAAPSAPPLNLPMHVGCGHLDIF